MAAQAATPSQASADKSTPEMSTFERMSSMRGPPELRVPILNTDSSRCMAWMKPMKRRPMNSRMFVDWKKTPSSTGSAASGTMAHRNTSFLAQADRSRKYAAIGAYQMTPHNRMASSTTKARNHEVIFQSVRMSLNTVP